MAHLKKSATTGHLLKTSTGHLAKGCGSTGVDCGCCEYFAGDTLAMDMPALSSAESDQFTLDALDAYDAITGNLTFTVGSDCAISETTECRFYEIGGTTFTDGILTYRWIIEVSPTCSSETITGWIIYARIQAYYEEYECWLYDSPATYYYGYIMGSATADCCEFDWDAGVDTGPFDDPGLWRVTVSGTGSGTVTSDNCP